MKHLMLITLLLFALNGDDTYLLPHRWHDARHEMNLLIRHANTPLVIVTGSFTDTHLQRALRKSVKAGHSVLLMTDSEHTASRWAMYQSVHACIFPPDQALGFSLIAVEGERACLISEPLDAEALQHSYRMVLCDDASRFSQTLKLLKQECRDYFTGKSR